MRKFILCTLIIAFTVIAIGCTKNSKSEASAQAEMAMELSTGSIITEKNSDSKLPMASTTKILTAIIIIEDCDLDEEITVPDQAVGVEGSSIYLKKNETIDVRDLIFGLMLRSGNDSAAALAIHHSGSIEAFVKVMNERAESIGAINSNFTNPSGLPDAKHYTTAYDLCKIACYAMKNETFKSIVSTTNYTGKFRSYSNKNKMLYNYDGANGIKTGYTVKAGRCLVSSAERNGMIVVCVVLNCPDMYERSSEILDMSFNNYKLLKLSNENTFMCDNVLCKLKNTNNILLKSGSVVDYKVKRLESDIDNAFALLEIYCENDLIFSEKLYSIIDE